MTKKNKITPLKKAVGSNEIEDITGLDQFSLDKIAGVGASAIQPKTVDTKGIDEQITALEKPASGSVYDKMAARYRSQGEGAVLRTQKNLANLFGPTVNLIQEREAAAQARFTLLKDKMPEFDDSTIFGHQSGNEMPIVDEVKNISTSVKEDLRMLSRLNPNDERYDEIKKRVEKNQDAIVAFDEINKKLLEIRNSPNDESQWSKGMDQTTADMWRDIYASKGENIKIVDGKLVWTDTRGKTSYEFKGGSFDDDKLKALGGTKTVLGTLAYQTRNVDGSQFTFKNGQKDVNVKGTQTALIEGGFTDADGNELDPDGEWGDKSQQAYDKYLAQKDELETAWLDENLTDEEKKKLGTTTGVGETRTIDLNEIGDGPTMIDNIGIEKDIEIQDGIQMLINSNIEVDDPRYDAKINQLVRTLNSAGPKGIKSLIFDGFGADPTDPLKSTNTNSFIEQIIRNNPEEFGIKDIENLTEEEIANAYEIMRSRDVTYQYNNSEDKPQTLQSQYIQWYRNEIDTKVREGKKSKLVATQQGTSANTSNKSNRRNRSTNNTTTTTTTADTGPPDYAVDFVDRFGTDTNQMFTELTVPGSFGTDKDNILFNYDDSDFEGYHGATVANTLNEAYGVSKEDFGEFKNAEGTESGARMAFYFEEVGGMEDVIKVHYRNYKGQYFTTQFEIDNMSDDSDMQSAVDIQKWMREKVIKEQDYIKAINADNVTVYNPENTDGGGAYDPDTDVTTTDDATVATDDTTDATTTNTTTFRSTMNSGNQERVNKFKIVGSLGTNKAKIFKNNEPITADIKVAGGLVTVSITGVKALGDRLIVGTTRGDQDLGRFEKRGDKYVFVPGNAYQYLDGEDKKDFDAFKDAIESDSAFAEEVRKSVTGNTDFETKNY